MALSDQIGCGNSLPGFAVEFSDIGNGRGSNAKVDMERNDQLRYGEHPG